MVAEVNLYWLVYENCSKSSVDLPSTHAALHEWREEWKFLFSETCISSPPHDQSS
jgi:hypothetical protein